jgi:hypothetical protein
MAGDENEAEMRGDVRSLSRFRERAGVRADRRLRADEVESEA